MAPVYPPRFGNFEVALANLGQIFGLAGLTLMSLNFVLSIDAKWLEKVFLGLNDVYKNHGLFGKMGFVMLMLHPLLLLNKFTELTFGGITGFLLPGKEWDINFGIFALWLMAVLIILTLYLRPKYHIWKNTHKFMGLALILAGFHVWLIPATVSYYKPLRYYMLAVLAAGVTAFVYKTLLGWLLQPKHILTVSDVKKMNEQVTEISLTPQKSFTYQAGQFLIISFLDKAIGKESHPFSIVSAPDEDVIRLAVKNLGDYTSKIQQLKTGVRVKARGPFGIFNYKIADSKKQIWIAGGIGITPFVSMAEDLSKTGKNYEIDLFYAVNKMEDAVYLERLKEIAMQIPDKFRVFTMVNTIGESLSADSVILKTDGFEGKRFFLCGPPGMMQAVQAGLKQLGVAKNYIKSEEFSL
jgi:predicted ferric reductase